MIALVALVALAQEPKTPAAWAELGDTLAAHDAPYAATLAYVRAAEKGTLTADQWTVLITGAERVGDAVLIEPVLAKPPKVELDTELRARAALHGARALIRAGDAKGAYERLGTPAPGSPHHAEIQALRGVVLSTSHKWSDALVALLTAQKTTDDPELEALVTLNLGRTFYGSGNQLKAIEYYAVVPRDSVLWPEAQFERAWAHFAIADLPGTLSMLHTLRSPLLEDVYNPEADLLRIQSLFLLCKFQTAGEEIDAFTAHYTPLKAELDGAVGVMSPADAWADATGWLDGDTHRLPAPLLTPLRREDRFAGARTAVAAATAEALALGASTESWATVGADLLHKRSAAIVDAEGGRVLGRARAAQTELGKLLDAVQLTKLDILTFQTDLLTRAAATGELAPMGDRIGRLRDFRRRPDVRVWPYEGEAWADELGYYVVDVRPDCPEGF